MTTYINKGKRTFIIFKDNKKVKLEPLQVVELSKEDYKKLEGFKEIQLLSQAKSTDDIAKEELKQKIADLEKQLAEAKKTADKSVKDKQAEAKKTADNKQQEVNNQTLTNDGNNK